MANRMISVSIDEAAQEAYDAIPRGEKSRVIRELLIDGSVLKAREIEVEGLRIALRNLKWRYRQLRIKHTNFKLGLKDAGWISPDDQEVKE